MAETKQSADQPKSQTEQPKPAAKAEPAPATAGLLPAAEASNPEVHQLLADRQVHVALATPPNEPDDVKEARKAAQGRVDDIDKRLADLGYTAQ